MTAVHKAVRERLNHARTNLVTVRERIQSAQADADKEREKANGLERDIDHLEAFLALNPETVEA